MEQSFARHYVDTGDVRYSAHKAGFAHAQKGWAKLSNPAIMRAIEDKTRERVVTMQEKCLIRLDKALDDPRTTTKDVIGIGRLLLQHKVANGDTNQDEHELPMDELIKKLETRMSDLRVIAGETVDVFS